MVTAMVTTLATEIVAGDSMTNGEKPNRDYDQRDSYEQDDYDRSRNSEKCQVHFANHTERRLDEMTPRGCFTTIFCGLGQGESISND